MGVAKLWEGMQVLSAWHHPELHKTPTIKTAPWDSSILTCFAYTLLMLKSSTHKLFYLRQEKMTGPWMRQIHRCLE